MKFSQLEDEFWLKFLKVSLVEIFGIISQSIWRRKSGATHTKKFIIWNIYGGSNLIILLLFCAINLDDIAILSLWNLRDHDFFCLCRADLLLCSTPKHIPHASIASSSAWLNWNNVWKRLSIFQQFQFESAGLAVLVLENEKFQFHPLHALVPFLRQHPLKS